MSVMSEHFDRLTVLNRCLSAVTDLMIPEKDINHINREDLCTLLALIKDEQTKTLSAMETAL